jgi:hypothetical protein
MPTPIGTVSLPAVARSVGEPTRRNYCIYGIRKVQDHTEVLVDSPHGLSWLQVAPEQTRLTQAGLERNPVFAAEGPSGLAIVAPASRIPEGFDIHFSAMGSFRSAWQKDINAAVNLASTLAGAPAQRVA